MCVCVSICYFFYDIIVMVDGRGFVCLFLSFYLTKLKLGNSSLDPKIFLCNFAAEICEILKSGSHWSGPPFQGL